MPQIYDMGPPALLPLRRKGCWGFFSPWKIRRLRPGFNPQTWVLEASTHHLDHRSRYTWCIYSGFEPSTLSAWTRPQRSKLGPKKREKSVISDADEAIMKLTDQTDMKGSDRNDHDIRTCNVGKIIIHKSKALPIEPRENGEKTVHIQHVTEVRIFGIRFSSTILRITRLIWTNIPNTRAIQ
jgi:hypothetical protein